MDYLAKSIWEPSSMKNTYSHSIPVAVAEGRRLTNADLLLPAAKSGYHQEVQGVTG